jgi:hypothetical protein
LIIRVKNVGDREWVWPYNEDGPERVPPGAEIDVELPPGQARQPGETSLEFRARVDRECDAIETTGTTDPRRRLMDALYKAGELVAVMPVETMH